MDRHAHQFGVSKKDIALGLKSREQEISTRADCTIKLALKQII
jgi:hypothetical protein